MSVRRFGVLLRGLPASARTWAKENGRWTNTDHLVAQNTEMGHLVYRGVIAPYLKSGQQPEPFHVARPGEKPKPSGWASFMGIAQVAKPAKKAAKKRGGG